MSMLRSWDTYILSAAALHFGVGSYLAQEGHVWRNPVQRTDTLLSRPGLYPVFSGIPFHRIGGVQEAA